MTANTAMHNAPHGPHVIVNPAYRWKSYEGVQYVGHGLAACDALAALDDSLTLSIFAEQVLRTLFAQKEFGSGILTIGRRTIAWVDHIRTYPVYYAFTAGGVIVSNDARSILAQLGDAQADENAALEFAMSGYVTGQDTLYREIKCLLPGEVIIAEDGMKPFVGRYFRYFPVPDNSKAPREAQAELAGIIDSIMLKIIARANGRPIWVPLSAGLDSRIILCKLHEHGYKNLHTFTYGPRFNFEAQHAKKIALSLNVPWHFVGLKSQECTGMFADKSRRAYSDFADGLKAAPSFREYTAIKVLKDRKVFHKDTILINGQSGDFITGGHVAPVWFEKDTASFDDLAIVLLAKHYDLWKGLKTPQNVAAIKSKIRSLLPEADKAQSGTDHAVLEECWEYDERQATLVVNGQRSYDFFGYDWELPLWERTLCDFYATVPYDQKRGQSLFKQFLKAYNYLGLFVKPEPKVWRWPLPMLWILPAANIIGLFSAEKKKEIYAFMRYYGHYSNQYAFFPFALHKQTYKNARNIFSLYVRNWFTENRFPLSRDLKKGMMLDD